MKKGFSHITVNKRSRGKSVSKSEKEKSGKGRDSSSPVCYIGHEKFREGFEDLNKKS